MKNTEKGKYSRNEKRYIVWSKNEIDLEDDFLQITFLCPISLIKNQNLEK